MASVGVMPHIDLQTSKQLYIGQKKRCYVLTGHESIKLNGANNVTRGLCTQRTHLTAIGRTVQGLLGTENDGTSNIKTLTLNKIV